MRPEQKGRDLGKAVIQPDHDAVAGKPYAWDIIFTCGKKSITDRGVIRFDVPYGFTPPQISYPSQTGFTTVETSNSNLCAVIYLKDPRTDAGNEGTWAVHLYVQVERGRLEPGDTVTVHYGKGHGVVSAGAGAFTRYFEGEAEFTVLVDPDGSRSSPHGGFQLVDDPQPRVRIVGDVATHLFVVAPSIVRPERPFPVKLTVRDQYENTVSGVDKEIVLTLADNQEYVGRARLDKRGCCVVRDISVRKEVPFRIAARDADNLIRGVSNPCLPIGQSDSPNIYWGDVHVMTEISAGLARPATAYEYARDMSHLDFCAVTDGDDADGFYTNEEWEETKEAVRKFYAPGQFVTLLAYEYHERRKAGDKNIYYCTDEAGLFRWSDLEGEQPQALWKALEGTRALTVPHHTVSGSGGLRPWDYHHPEFQRLVEIYSVWGNSECDACSRPNFWHNNFENSVQNGLARGYRMGIIASGDSHDGLAGNSSWLRLRRGYRNGMVAVYASELTRNAVFDALWNRACYGTSGERIILSFGLNAAHMGEELSGEHDRARRHLRVRATGTAPVREITVVRNGNEVHVYKGSAEDEGFEWIDKDDFGDVSLTDYRGQQFIYYYVRVVQNDGELAWSSPIWVS